MSLLKFKFDGNFDYQQRAIECDVSLFEGQPLANETYSLSIETQEEGGNQLSLGDDEFSNIATVANQLVLTDELLQENLQKKQEENNVPKQSELAGAHFSVEMETSTGTIYVYLRILLELNKCYGFTKFIVVVPSIAIRKEVQKSLVSIVMYV